MKAQPYHTMTIGIISALPETPDGYDALMSTTCKSPKRAGKKTTNGNLDPAPEQQGTAKLEYIHDNEKKMTEGQQADAYKRIAEGEQADGCKSAIFQELIPLRRVINIQLDMAYLTFRFAYQTPTMMDNIRCQGARWNLRISILSLFTKFL